MSSIVEQNKNHIKEKLYLCVSDKKENNVEFSVVKKQNKMIQSHRCDFNFKEEDNESDMFEKNLQRRVWRRLRVSELLGNLSVNLHNTRSKVPITHSCCI